MRDITINDILKMLLAHIKLIIILTVVLALGGYIYADNFIQKSYSASTMISILVTPTTTVVDPDAVEDGRISYNSISSSESLANNITTLFTYASEIDEICPPGYYFSVSPVNESNYMRITVSGADGQVCADTANAIRSAAPEVVAKYYKGGEAVPFSNPATAPYTHSSPNASRYAMFGGIAGLIISILIAIILEVIDTTIKSSDDLYKIYDIPVFAEIVDFDSEGGAKKR